MSSLLGRLVIAAFILQPTLEQCCLIIEPQNIMKLSAPTVKEGSGLCFLIMIKLQGLVFGFLQVCLNLVCIILHSLHIYILHVSAKWIMN